MKKIEQGARRLDAAAKRLRWSKTLLYELRAHASFGRMDDVERVFCTLLFHLYCTRACIEVGCRLLGLDGLTKRFKEDCLSDPLLKYMWRARDAVAHDTIISWNNRGHLVEIEVFDAEKANAVPRRFSTLIKEGGHILDLLAYIYEANSTAELDRKARENFRPSERAMEAAGVKIVYAAETILLHEFSYRAKEQGKKITIARPTTHLGKQIPAQADIASEETIKFYDAMLDLARTLLNALATRPQATGMP